MATTALVSCRRSYAILPAASSTCICAYADYRHATAPYNNNSGIHNGANQSEASTAGSDKRDGCVNACYWTNYYDSCVLFIHVVRLLRMAEHMRQRGWWRTHVHSAVHVILKYCVSIFFFYILLFSTYRAIHWILNKTKWGKFKNNSIISICSSFPMYWLVQRFHTQSARSCSTISSWIWSIVISSLATNIHLIGLKMSSFKIYSLCILAICK